MNDRVVSSDVLVSTNVQCNCNISFVQMFLKSALLTHDDCDSVVNTIFYNKHWEGFVGSYTCLSFPFQLFSADGNIFILLTVKMRQITTYFLFMIPNVQTIFSKTFTKSFHSVLFDLLYIAMNVAYLLAPSLADSFHSTK